MKQMKKCLTLALAVLLALGLRVPTHAAVEDTGYADVNAGHPHAEAIVYCREHGLMNGTSSTTFEPESTLTRAMLATVLYRAANSPAVTGTDSFTDTVEGSWYSNAVLWASQQGLVGGYGGGIFGANDPVTRQDMTTILWRYAGSPSAGASTFSDSTSISSYAASAVAWAQRHGIVAPASGSVFAPRDNATRAQVAAALMNYSLTQETVPSGNARVLVAYFSRYGNTDYDSNVDATTSASVVVENGQRQGTTELIARMIAEQTGGDLHLIETADSYPTDFNDVVDQNHQEIGNGARPTLTSSVDVSKYDVIFVGYPVWASTAPTPVLSFLEGLNLSGKTVVPFCTHTVLKSGILEYIQQLKQAGTVRHIGLSSHTPRLVNKVLDMGVIDMVMFSINPGYDYRHGEYAIGSVDERAALYRRCEADGVGISVMKAFSGGQLLNARTSPFGKALTEYQCIQYALDKPGVLTVLPGIRDRADLRRILGFLNATAEEKDYSVLGSFAPQDAAGKCVYCNHCQPCPAGLDVGLINKYYDLSRAGDQLAHDHYDKLEKKAGDCVKCGHCDKRCPFRVSQANRMTEIFAYFGR